jgi:hypothetical protein
MRGYEGNQGLLEKVDVGGTKGVDSSLKLFVLCRNKQRLAHDRLIRGLGIRIVTWGELGQLFCADMAETFLCGLHIRVETLCEL